MILLLDLEVHGLTVTAFAPTVVLCAPSAPPVVASAEKRKGRWLESTSTGDRARYGPTFTVPHAVNPPVAERVMDLSSPREKMSKSSSSEAGALRLLDEPTVLRHKIMRAVTDTGTKIAYDPDSSPGMANLLDILAGCTAAQPQDLAAQFHRYGELKQAVADAVVDTLAPVRTRYLQLTAAPDHVRGILRAGAKRAREKASDKLREAKSAIGLLPTQDATQMSAVDSPR